MQENIKKPRRHEISLLNVLFCLMVIFIHIISHAVSSLTPGSLSYNIAMFPWRSCSFVVQGFVMLAGIKLFLTKKDSLSYSSWLILRFKSIIVPYIFCYIAYYIFYMVVYDYPLDAAFILKHFFTGNLVCHMYFIPILVQFDLLMPLWKKIVNKCSPIIVIPFCILLSQLFEIALPSMLKIHFPEYTFIFNDRLFTTYLSFYIIGCYIGKDYESFLAMLKSNFKTIFTCFAITLPIFLCYTYVAYNNIAPVTFTNHLHTLYVYCAIFLIYCISVKIAPCIMDRVKLLRKIDIASYDIYLWHMLFLYLTNLFLEKFGIISQLYSFAIRTIIVYPVTIALSILLSYLRKKLNKKSA
ncbi:MAG: acyltransferase [Clostridia bacterium]|nr:acyltransferase [Clostridia bacterium]